MKISIQTIGYLRDIITGDSEKTPYLSGSDLVSFFGNFGFDDEYGQGFPSRWQYCEEKLVDLNNQNRIEMVIEYYYNPINFIGNKDYRDLIQELNEYLSFDDLELIVKGKKAHLQNKKSNSDDVNEVERFLDQDFEVIDFKKLNLDPDLIQILDQRLLEIEKNLNANSPLSVIFLAGSILEGVFFGLASQNSKVFNSSSVSPKHKGGKVKKFADWTLNDYINVAKEIGYIEEDVKKFSHELRDFRNYIHPHHQKMNKFTPNKKTAEICFKVLELAISQIAQNK